MTREHELCESLQHMEQATAEAMKWHEATGHFQTDRERAAFRAAFAEGWRGSMADASLHGYGGRK